MWVSICGAWLQNNSSTFRDERCRGEVKRIFLTPARAHAGWGPGEAQQRRLAGYPALLFVAGFTVYQPLTHVLLPDSVTSITGPISKVKRLMFFDFPWLAHVYKAKTQTLGPGPQVHCLVVQDSFRYISFFRIQIKIPIPLTGFSVYLSLG